jgi:cyclopropane fatty-acyl-phospholipid synthase-like methyltransferase
MATHPLSLVFAARAAALLLLATMSNPLAGCASSSSPPPHDGHEEGHHGHHDHRGGAPHRFQNAEEWVSHFEGPERDAWQKPDAVVAALGLGPAQSVADIGAGTGYFAVRFARQAPGGKVFGIDIEPDMIRYMTGRAAREKLPNLVPVLGAADSPAIPGPVDLVFVCDTYHHIEQRTAYFQKVAASLAPGGRLVIVDFKAIDTPVGPPLAMRVAPSQIDAELAPAGFKRASLDEATLPHQYIVIYTR